MTQEFHKSGIYYVVPSEVFDDERLNPSQLKCYILISGLSHSCGYCYASNEYLAKRLKCKTRFVSDCLSSLESFGYVKRSVVRTSKGTDRKIFVTHARTSPPPCSMTTKPTCSEMHGGMQDTACIVSEVLVSELREEEYCPVPSAPPPPPGETMIPSISNKIQISEEAKILANYFDEKLCSLYPKRKRANLEQWAKEFDKIIRIDKKTSLEIKEMLEWALDHSFWVKNVLSPSKLREQWDKLYAQKNPPENKGNRIHWNKVEAREAESYLRSKRDGRSDKMKIWEHRVEKTDTKEHIPFDLPSKEFVFKLCEMFNIRKS